MCPRCPILSRVSFRIFVKGGGGGANATVGELRGGKDYSNNSSVLYRIFHQQGILWCSLTRGVWGYAPPGKFKKFQPLRLHLVASETKLSGLGRSL